jgi:hypothetical protein
MSWAGSDTAHRAPRFAQEQGSSGDNLGQGCGVLRSACGGDLHLASRGSSQSVAVYIYIYLFLSWGSKLCSHSTTGGPCCTVAGRQNDEVYCWAHLVGWTFSGGDVFQPSRWCWSHRRTFAIMSVHSASYVQHCKISYTATLEPMSEVTSAPATCQDRNLSGRLICGIRGVPLLSTC